MTDVVNVTRAESQFLVTTAAAPAVTRASSQFLVKTAALPTVTRASIQFLVSTTMAPPPGLKRRTGAITYA